MRGCRAITPGVLARQPSYVISTGSSRTFLALARTPILCGQDVYIASCVGRAGLTKRLGRLLLVEVAEVVAANAAELTSITLEQSCRGQIAKNNMARSATREPTEMPCVW